MKAKTVLLWMMVLAAMLTGTGRAEVVLDVSFGHLGFDADGLTADGQMCVDTSGNGYHGFYAGGSGAAATAGVTDSTAFDTSGANVYIILRDARTYTGHGETGFADPLTTPTPYFTLEADKNYTFEAILKWDPTNTQAMHGIMGQTGGNEFWMRENNGALQWAIVGGGTNANNFGTDVDISVLEADGQWHHLAFVLDRTASEIRIYADYELIYTDSNPNIASLGEMLSGTGDFRIGGYNTSSSTRFKGAQDHFRISNTALNPAEFLQMGGASAPMPADGDAGVLVDADLSWTAAADPNAPLETVTGQYIYLGTDPMALVLQNTTAQGPAVTTFDPGTLNKDSRYYWRVDSSVNGSSATDPNTITGLVWNFDTELSLPVIEQQPQLALVYPGENAVFDVNAFDPLGGTLTYQWYSDPDLEATGDEVMLSDGADYSGVTTAALTVLAAEQTDEGYFYCDVSNAATISTGSAYLAVKRLIAHFPFDNDANDVVTNMEAVVSGVSIETDSIVGTGSVLFDSATDSLYFASDGWNSNAWSFSWWEYSTPGTGFGTDGWEAMLASGPSSGFEIFEFSRLNDVRYGYGVTGNYINVGDLARGQWIHHVVTYDPTAEDSDTLWYVNGVGAEKVGWNSGDFTGFDDIYVGIAKNGTQPFSGNIDDLKFYNYALTALEVAQEYTAVKTDETVCTEYPANDFDENCKVDLADFALMATEWLECNIYPDCLTVIP